MPEPPTHGQLRIAWYPQVPCQPFHVYVVNLDEARLVYDTLARYDLFQLEQQIKPDFASVGDLEIWDEPAQEWQSWESEDGDLFSDVMRGDAR